MAHRRPTYNSRFQPPSSSSSSRRRNKSRKTPSSVAAQARRRAQLVLGLALPNRKRSSRQSSVSSRNSHAPSASSASLDSDTDTDSGAETPRPVLAPLHFNLRRLPSRLALAQQNESMRGVSSSDSGGGPVRAGAKRKRVASGNENVESHKTTRRSQPKRRKASDSSDEEEESVQEEEERASSMEVDDHDGEEQQGEEDEEEEEEHGSDQGSDDEHSSEDYLINAAPPQQLGRLRKDHLIRLYTASGLFTDHAESLTKKEIVEAIMAAREEVASLPPSSPPGRDGGSSEYSSDDGNAAGGEETDFAPRPSGSNGLRRRATMNTVGAVSSRPRNGRSYSLGNIEPATSPSHARRSLRNSNESVEEMSIGHVKRKSSWIARRSSPITSNSTASTSNPNPFPSPPATRLRSRKISADSNHAPSTPVKASSKGKGKAKQVEFSDDIHVAARATRPHVFPHTPAQTQTHQTRHNHSHRTTEPNHMASRLGLTPTRAGEESDLTEPSESEAETVVTTQPSPRRLRSKDKVYGHSPSRNHVRSHSGAHTRSTGRRSTTESQETPKSRRVTKTQPHRMAMEMEVENEGEGEEEVEEEEVDELMSSKSPSPRTSSAAKKTRSSKGTVLPPPQLAARTPLKRRLRPRTVGAKQAHVSGVARRPRKVQTYTPPSDGDDEGEEEEFEFVDGEEDVEEIEVDESEQGAEEQGEEEEGDADEDAEIVEEEQEDASAEEGDEEVEESVDGEEVEADAEEQEEEEELVAEPRRLRNGKVVGEDEEVDEEGDEEVEMDEQDEGTQDGSEEETAANASQDEDIDLEEASEESDASNESEYVDDVMEDVDLTIATAKSLVRHRRDVLVRLCESRDLDVEGTKPELASALLQWRDRQESPSSTGTVRPPSTARPRANGRRKRSSGSPNDSPVLLRSHHVHLDEPRTPPISSPNGHGKDKDEELELDLESLGLDDREIPPEKLTKLEKIGSGGFKDVFIGKFKGRKVAISEFRGQLSAMDIKELKLLGGFNHPNIVRFLGVSIPEDTRITPVMIVSELCSNGDLFDYVRNVPPPSLYRILSIMLDIARGLEYLHLRKPSVIHRDCKSSNILITSKGVAKIADFGLAKVKQSTRSMVRSLVGTVNWQAPELWHAHPKYNHKVDVFAAGAVFWEMLQWHLPNKKYPWEGMNEHAIYELVGAKRQRPSLTGLRRQYCPEIVDLIDQMWAQEHQDRPTMSEVVQELERLVKAYR